MLEIEVSKIKGKCPLFEAGAKSSASSVCRISNTAPRAFLERNQNVKLYEIGQGNIASYTSLAAAKMKIGIIVDKLVGE